MEIELLKYPSLFDETWGVEPQRGTQNIALNMFEDRIGLEIVEMFGVKMIDQID